MNYTKEMQEANIPPEMGMKFICSDNNELSRIEDFKGLEVEVIGVCSCDDQVVITFKHSMRGIGCGIFSPCWVKPIDTRAEEEKSILKVNNYVSIAVRGGKHIDDVYSDCVIKYIGSKWIVFVELTTKREFTRKLSRLKFKPMDTRTDTEKAVDDIDEALTSINCQIYDAVKKENCFGTESKLLLGVIKAGKITDVKWVGND